MVLTTAVCVAVVLFVLSVGCTKDDDFAELRGAVAWKGKTMTLPFNPLRATDLARQALEDDSKMTPGEWLSKPGPYYLSWVVLTHGGETVAERKHDMFGHDAAGIARSRNALREMAEQLKRERDEARRERDYFGYDSLSQRTQQAESNVAEYMRQLAESRVELAASLESERNAVNELAKMRPVYEAALRWFHADCDKHDETCPETDRICDVKRADDVLTVAVMSALSSTHQAGTK